MLKDNQTRKNTSNDRIFVYIDSYISILSFYMMYSGSAQHLKKFVYIDSSE